MRTISYQKSAWPHLEVIRYIKNKTKTNGRMHEYRTKYVKEMSQERSSWILNQIICNVIIGLRVNKLNKTKSCMEKEK